jgi:alpha,alpha-trehalase
MWIEEARRLKLNSDFMFLSGLRELPLDSSAKAHAEAQAEQLGAEATARALKAGQSLSEAQLEGRKVTVAAMVNALFEPGANEWEEAPRELYQSRWQLEGGSPGQYQTVAYIENLWSKLVKRTPPQTRSSLIPLPFPVIIPGARFQESYYWDSYFGIQALIRTGRWKLAAMQVENFLYMINTYGLVPNGMRDHYLTRSQPPLLSSMVRDVYQAALQAGQSRDEMNEWLRHRVFPLLKRDYFDFWMNPQTRFDAETGLNHHWDAENTPRPERHSADDEESLAATYRDVRSEAESGKDFTVAFEGRASRMAPVLLNAIMYKIEKDLSWMARTLGDHQQSRQFWEAATHRRAAIDRYLYDPERKAYYDYNLERRGRSTVLTADIYAMLWAGVASRDQARGVRDHLKDLEVAGGILASNVNSGKQWDAPFVWAPHIFFSADGLQNYGYRADAVRIVTKFNSAIDRIFARTGAIFEKIDGVLGDLPVERGDKYATQEGFLWTNSVYLWGMTDILGYRLVDASVSKPQQVTSP